MANYTSTHTGAVIDASVTKVSSSGVTQADLSKLNAVTSSATELNLLDGVTASTSELNILDGATVTVTELNYLDGADSSITTLSLPDNTTITTFGASLVDDADAATARTTLGVDPAGTDNSTDVTLVTTSYDYLSLSGQAITLGQIDISDDTNLVGGDGLALTGDTLSVNVDDSSIEINSDTLRVKALGVTNAMLAGSIANAKLSNSSVSYGGVSVALGSSDATPAFDLSDATSLPIVAGTTGTLSVARGGTGATTASGARTSLNVDVAGTDNSTDVTLVTTSHDYLSLSGQAVTLGQIDISDDTNLVGGTGITLTGDTLSTTDSEIVHDNLSGFVANEHIDHSGVSITAGAGLTGGGDITATRDIAVGAGTGVTVNADDIAIGQDVATSADVEFNSVTADIIGDIRGATKFTAKADVALNIGDAVYISGVSGNTPTVDIADANDASKMPSFGLAGSSVSINGSVEIFTFGTLPGLNTSSFSVGDILYVSTNGTSGNTLTATKPTGESSLLQNIGTVQRSHASAGSIKVGGAGRTNATPNLDDGDIFIGNGSNQAVSAALNTKIQDYLNTGVNLPSPTFSGDIDFSDASTPTLTITDSTNTAQLRLFATDTTTDIGSLSAHKVNFRYNNDIRVQLEDSRFLVNAGSDDMDFIIKDTSAQSLIHSDAALSRVGILDSTPSYTLDVNGTGRFTGAVQLDDNLTVTGDLQVNGTTTTVNQTNLDVSDNIIGLNRGASTNANDSGLIIERGSTGDNAAIIFDESADKFTVGTTTSTPSATGNITVTTGTMVANVEGNVTGNVTGDVTGDVTGNADTATALATGRDISLTGDVTGTTQVAFDGSGNASIATTIAANSVALGTDTTGNYMSDLTEGTGIDITHTPAEGSNATITLDLTEVGFGGGANRLITDDGDGTVSTEANLTFDGTDLAIAATGKIYLDGGGNTYITEELPDQIILRAGGGNYFKVSPTNGVVVNDPGANVDFRVEGDTDQNLLFTDASADRVGIGTASPSNKLDVSGDVNISQNSYYRISNRAVLGGDSSYLEIWRPNGAVGLYLGGADERNYYDNNNHRFRTSGGAANLGEWSSTGLGIGTTSPSEKLHVYGSVDNDDVAVHIQNAFDDDSSATPPSAALTFTTASNNAYLRVFGAPADTADNHKIELGSTAASSYITFKPSGSEAMRITSGGDVGIGTVSPEVDLHIVDDTYSQLRVETSGAGNVEIETQANDNSDEAFFGTRSNHDLKFRTNWTNAMTIDTSQNVGIGTTSPGALLDVNGTAYLRTAVFSDTFKPYSGTLATYGSSSSTDHYFVGDVGIGTTSPSAYLHTEGASSGTESYAKFSTGSAAGDQILTVKSSSSRDHMALQVNTGAGATDDLALNPDGGNVGIGVVSPGYKLDVSGNVRFTSDLRNEGRLLNSVGSSASPSYSFYSQGNAGMYRSGDGVGFSAAGSSVFDINSTRMYINTNVGIGTTSPDYELDVAGDIGVDHLITHNSDSNTYVQFTSDRLRFAAGGEVLLDLYEDGTQDYVKLGDGGDVDINLNDDMFVEGSSGNVGIGTVSPQSKLNINVAAESAIPSAGNDTTFLMIGNDASGTTNYGTMIGTLNTGNGYIQQQRFDGTATTYNLLLQPNGGNVGIGTTSPNRLLHLQSTGDAIMQITSANGSGAYIDLGDVSDVDGGRIVYDSGSNLIFNTASTERLRIEADGDVLPGADGTQDLGSLSKRWGVIYSADLDLSNEGSQNDVDGTWGSYVIQEGEDDLFLINRRSGKKYKFMLQEVQD